MKIPDSEVVALIRSVKAATNYYASSWSDEQCKDQEEELRHTGGCDPEYSIFKDFERWLWRNNYEVEKLTGVK